MRKLTFWLTLLLIFTIPFEDSITLNSQGTFSVTRLFGLVVAGFWFMTIVMQGRFRKPVLFHALVLFFFLWSILSYFWTVNLEDTFFRVKTYAQIFILILIIWEMLQTPEELKAGLQAYILGSFVLIASSISNYLQGNVAESYEVRFSATGVNAVDLALFLLLGLPIAWRLFLYPIQNSRILKFINLAYLPLAVFTVLLTASRTSLFAVLPALIFIAMPKKLDAGRILLTAIGLVLVVIIFQGLLPAAIFERLASVGTSIRGADIGGRVNLWAESVTVFTQYPLHGSGSGSLSAIIGAISHQTFLSVLAETGLVGFILFGIVLCNVFLEIWKLPKGYLGLWLSTFFVWVIGVLSLSFEFRKITWLFFSFMIIQGCSLREQWQAARAGPRPSEAEETSTMPAFSERPALPDLKPMDQGPVE